MRHAAIKYQIFAALIFLAALGLIHPMVENGMNDDWSYVRTALDLARTGHLRYNGWSAPLIGFQAYWGALFIQLFGFSFLVVRASVWVLTLLFIPVCWQLFRRAGLSEHQSFFGLIAFLLSPLNLPDLTTFMTDMPAFFLFAAALLSALKAWDANSDKRAVLQICSSTVCCLLSGSVRQIYWLSGISFLAVLGVKRMRTRKGRALIVICMALIAAAGWAGSRWLVRQPYIPFDITPEVMRNTSLTEILASSGRGLAKFLMGTALLCIPFSLLRNKRKAVWRQLSIVCAAVVITGLLAQPLPWPGNTMTQNGILLAHTVSAGDKATVLPSWLILLLGSAGIVSAVDALSQVRWTAPSRFVLLALPFLLGYVATLVLRSAAFGMYDRYLIPVVFLVGAMALAAYGKDSPRVGVASWSAVIVFAIYAIATTHDYFAEARAKLRATEEVLRSGQSRETVLSGFEFDCWTQVERSGHVNGELLKYPANAYRQIDDCNGPEETQMWWRTLAPDMQARYVVSLTPLNNLAATNFKPVAYWRWLPPGKNRIYVQQTSPPLTCKPDPD